MDNLFFQSYSIHSARFRSSDNDPNQLGRNKWQITYLTSRSRRSCVQIKNHHLQAP